MSESLRACSICTESGDQSGINSDSLGFLCVQLIRVNIISARATSFTAFVASNFDDLFVS